MRKIYPLLLGIALFACTTNSEQNATEDLPPINELFDRFYEESLNLDPIIGNSMGVTGKMDTLPNYLTNKHSQLTQSHFNSFLIELNKYDADKLSGDDLLNYEILKWYCETLLETDPTYVNFFISNKMLPIDQFLPLSTLITMMGTGSSFQPFNTVQDYDNWLSRLQDYSMWLDQALINMQRGLELGYKLPKTIIEKTIPQWEGFVATPIQENIFYIPIKNMPHQVSQEDSLRLAKNFTSLIENELSPRYEKISDFLKNDYLNNPRSTDGISSIPNGKSIYKQLLKINTTTNLSPDSIFNLGMSEIHRIRNEMEIIKDKVGFKGTLSDFFEHIRTNPDLMPYTKPEQVIEHFHEIHETIKPKLKDLFINIPDYPFEVKRVEAFRESSAQATYMPGTPDRATPGTFHIPIPDVKAYNIYRDEALFLHEAIPGHHYQASLLFDNNNMKEFRKLFMFNASGEGWGLYAESLGKELGLYSDSYQYFGMLGMEMHRAIRLVVDVGLHYKDWTREEAIQFSLDNEPESEASVTAEVERYMVMPGQATSYKIGQLTILALRKKAEETLGNQFDIREFHNQILKDGDLPLALLESKVKRWIEESSQAQ
tara:strand:+ start:577 stop:2376 length:1800 start_codon:yes stop_codon:yes gene_type:complete